MKRVIVLGVLLSIITGCFSQHKHLYYDKSKYSLIVQDLEQSIPFYLLLPVKSNEEMYEIYMY